MSCLRDPDNLSRNSGDEPFIEGNVIFVGIVTDIDFEQKSDEISCMSVKFKPSEMLFGSKSESFGFKICGPDMPQSLDSDHFQIRFGFFGVGIGNELLVGLTKEPLPRAQEGYDFESDFRFIFLDCMPALIRLDRTSEDERKSFLDETRKQIRDRASK